jgi:BirA family biotin operon repressor/biotin-[acetyl-CoA-carboxylase] ligase
MKDRIFVKKTVEFSKKLPSDFFKKLLVFNDLDSTNTTAKELARTGAEEVTVVITRTQSHGRGRFDRIWQSPAGGVYLSLILRPKTPLEKSSLLSFVAALVVTRAIDAYGLHASIKWPNDVRVNAKKIAGILVESEATGTVIDYAVVGVGINLNIDLADLSSDIRSNSTSLSAELPAPIDYHDFLNTFLQQFEKVYTTFRDNRFDSIINEWKNRTDTLGKKIQVETSTEILQGTAVDIDSSGFLLLRTKNGVIKKISSGDCQYLNELDHA